MELEIRHLRMIMAVAERGSVTKAAAALGLSQPALTAQLNRIDRALGGTVFTRDRHGARATPLGEVVLRHARVLLPAMAVLVDDARRMVDPRADPALSVRVGTVNTAIGGLFVNRVHAALDGVTVTQATSWSVDETAARLAAGRLDVALVGMCGDTTPPPDDRVAWDRVCSDPVFVLVGDDHPHADRTTVHLTELAGELWLNARGDGCFERCFVSECTRAGFTPRALGESERMAAFDQVRAGHAVALVQPVLLDVPGVRAVAIEGTPLRWTQYVGWRHDAAERLDVDAVGRAARFAHDDAVRRSPDYRRWLAHAGVRSRTPVPSRSPTRRRGPAPAAP